MTENREQQVEQEPTRQISLSKLASRNSMLSLLLFGVLVAIIVVASLRDRESMNELATVYDDQFRVEQFKASLSNIMVPLADFTMTAEADNFPKLKKAVADYKASYARIGAIEHLSDQDRAALNKVNGLMNEVMNIANDVASGKITAGQSADVTLLAQNLVLAAQKKLALIVKGLEGQLAQRTAEREQKANMQLYLMLGFIGFIILLLEYLNRGLLKQAYAVSRVSSSVAESAGDIIMVNKMQASTSDQQSRFMEKVIQGLKLIGESGQKIAASIASLSKNTEIIGAFAKGGSADIDDGVKALQSVRGYLDGDSARVAAGQEQNNRVLQSLQQIQEIADEAQLLAVNASIDSGGQESLTDEIQRMADRIRESCDEMRQLVQHTPTVDGPSADAGGTALEQAQEAFARTTAMLARIEKMAQKNSQSVSAIAAATERQNERNLKILQALQHISELLHISGNKVQAYSDASARLSKASESLQSLS